MRKRRCSSGLRDWRGSVSACLTRGEGGEGGLRGGVTLVVVAG